MFSKNPSLSSSLSLFYFSRIVICLCASFFIALCAQIVVPFYPIPMTMQPFAVLLLSLVLPRNLALGSLFFYYTESVLGLPFLTGGAGGLAPFVGPTAGFLLGYIAMTLLISSFYPRAKNLLMKVVVIVLGYGSLFACGAFVLSFFVGPEKAIATGVVPFLIKDTLQGALAMILAHFFRPTLKKLEKKVL